MIQDREPSHVDYNKKPHIPHRHHMDAIMMHLFHQDYQLMNEQENYMIDLMDDWMWLMMKVRVVVVEEKMYNHMNVDRMNVDVRQLETVVENTEVENQHYPSDWKMLDDSIDPEENWRI